MKYDGERVQIHKQGDTFTFFSRSLKLVAAPKIDRLLPQLKHCLKGHDGVFDGELVLADRITRQLLPFGTLGKKKQLEHPNGVPCVVLFDILALDGNDLTGHTLIERRRILVQMLEKENAQCEGFVTVSDATVGTKHNIHC